MPPPGHPRHPEMQRNYLPPARTWVDRARQPAGLAATQAALDELIPLLAQAVAKGAPPDAATHSRQIGAARFGRVPGCPDGHPECAVSYKGGTFGRGSSRHRYISWSFPAWGIFSHTAEVSDSDTSSGGGTIYETTRRFYVDVRGTIYGCGIEVIGDLTNGLSPELVPYPNERYADAPSGMPVDVVHAEINRMTAVLAGRRDPIIQTADAADDYVAKTLLRWLLSEMRKVNNPGAQKRPAAGFMQPQAWILIKPSGHLFVDGTIKLIGDKKRRRVRAGDEENLRTLARLSGLGDAPARPFKP